MPTPPLPFTPTPFLPFLPFPSVAFLFLSPRGGAAPSRPSGHFTALSPLICVLHISRATNRARRRPAPRPWRAPRGRRTGPRVSKNIRGSDGANGRARAAAVTSALPRRSAKKISQEEVSEGPCRNFLSYECILLFPSHVLVKKHKNKKVLRISMCMHDKMVTKSRRGLRRSTLLEIRDFVHAYMFLFSAEYHSATKTRLLTATTVRNSRWRHLPDNAVSRIGRR